MWGMDAHVIEGDDRTSVPDHCRCFKFNMIVSVYLVYSLLEN